ncbi:MAG: TonB-dependent receptor, partial [Chitinophagaceae bacterium]
MNYLLTALFLLCTVTGLQAQSNFRALVQNGEAEPLSGATVSWKEGSRSAVTDSAGLVVIAGIPSGTQTFTVTHVGYEEASVLFVFPLLVDTAIVITLEGEEHEHEEEVVVRATRTSRTITNTPTRIEVISGEEL